MSLLTQAMEDVVMLEKTRVPDGEGGFTTDWVDGVHQYPASDLTDEVFNGSVWAMAVPPAVIDLAAEIEEYNKSDAGKASPFTSESFGGYAYTKATDANGAPIGWKKAFASRLNQWRKL